MVEVDDVGVLDLGERLEDPLELLLLRLELLGRGEESLVPNDLNKLISKNHKYINGNVMEITSTPSSESMARNEVSMPGTSLYLISSRLFSHRPHGDSSVVSVSSSSVS